MKSGLQNPYQRALVTVGGLMGFALLTILAVWSLSFTGMIDLALAGIGFVFSVCFALFFVTIWLLGLRQIRHARAFLESDRPLIRWRYSSAEWQQIKNTVWQEEKDDWKLQWGCLILMFTLIGLLTGIMLGLEGDLIDVIANGGAGLIYGGLVGCLIGILVGGGNYLGARQSHQRSEPGQVALGLNDLRQR